MAGENVLQFDKFHEQESRNYFFFHWLLKCAIMSTDPFGESVPDGSRDLPSVLLCAAWMPFIILSRLCYLVLVGLNKVR